VYKQVITYFHTSGLVSKMAVPHTSHFHFSLNARGAACLIDTGGPDKIFSGRVECSKEGLTSLKNTSPVLSVVIPLLNVSIGGIIKLCTHENEEHLSGVTGLATESVFLLYISTVDL